jgi:tRNA(Glu) U13 pseudouridine synthase TruD
VTAKKVPVEKLLGFQKHNVRGIVIGDVEWVFFVKSEISFHRYVKQDIRLGDLTGNRFTITLR